MLILLALTGNTGCHRKAFPCLFRRNQGLPANAIFLPSDHLALILAAAVILYTHNLPVEGIRGPHFLLFLCVSGASIKEPFVMHIGGVSGLFSMLCNCI